jgi:hypothetical protein
MVQTDRKNKNVLWNQKMMPRGALKILIAFWALRPTSTNKVQLSFDFGKVIPHAFDIYD